jgi:hypothetical protein
MLNYTKLDEKIDKYIGTNNLRPGPPKRLINKHFNKNLVKEEKKIKINYCGESIEVNRNLNWGQ